METMLMTFMAAFARIVRTERARQNVTQEELAEMADITPQFLCKLENGRKTASIETYMRIAAALHLRLANLFSEDKSVNSSVEDTLIRLLGDCSDFEKRICLKAVEGILAGFREE